MHDGFLSVLRDTTPLVCLRTFSASNIPGYEGETLTFRGPQSGPRSGAKYERVCAEHPVVAAYPDHFAPDGSSRADAAIRSAQTRSPKASALQKRSRSTKASQPSRTASARRSQSDNVPPWRSKPTQTRRTRAVTGDDIYDLRTIRYSIDEPEVAVRLMRDRSLRAIERASFAHGRAEPDAIRSHLAELIADDEHGRLCRHILVTGAPDFRKAFAHLVQGGELSSDEHQMLRGIQLGEFAEGGYLVPYTLDPTIIPTSSGVVNPLRAISRLGICTANEWRGVSSAGMSAGYASEGSEASDDSPTFAQLKLLMHKADAWCPAAYEFDQDYASLEPALAALLQRTKDELEAAKFYAGTGENEPTGLLTGVTEVIETATKDTFVAADLETLEDALSPGFLTTATWLGARPIFKRVRGFDCKGGAPIWVKLPGSKPEINGLSAAELSTMDSTVAGGKQILVLGDFSYFQIVDRVGMTVKLIPEISGGRPTGEMGVYAMWRNSSKVLTPAAFRVLKVKAS